MSDARRTRILTATHVRALLSLDEIVELQRAAFVAQAIGTGVAAPSSFLRVPDGRFRMKLLAAHDEAGGVFAAKVLARSADAPPGRNVGALLILFDVDAFPLAVMDAGYITAARTGAGAAIATRALANQGARVLGIVGSGAVGRLAASAVSREMPSLASVLVHSRTPAHAAAAADELSSLLGLGVTTVPTAAEAFRESDVVVTATESPEPLADADVLHGGQHINALGRREELAPGLVAACRVIPDSRSDALEEGSFSTVVAAGLSSGDLLGPELGAVVAGHQPGRRAEDEITLFDSCGLALQDALCARAVWERAEEQDRGFLVDFRSDARELLHADGAPS